MAHFAQLGENNIVLQVVVISNSDTVNSDGVESEEVGIEFCKGLFGEDTQWAQTSYNANFRKNYAGIGYTYDVSIDAFVPPQPYPSWTLNLNTATWEAPVPMPDDGQRYAWDESTLSWDVLPTPAYQI